MIVRGRPKVWELAGIWRLSILPRIMPQLVLVAVVAGAWTWAAFRFARFFHGSNVAPFTLLGIALSIFLGFRNNACYDRWWEGRRQLGMLISEVRSLARFTLATPGGDRERRGLMVREVIAWVYALMSHLRVEPMAADVAQYARAFDPLSNQRDVPEALLQRIAEHYGAMHADGEFGEIIYQRIDERLSNMATIKAACERIRTTPTPFAYTLLLHRTAYAFCFLLPYGLVGELGYATPFFSALVAYAFFGLDALGNEMEEPFGDWPNALPLSAMARTMEISLLEALGETNIPEPLKPVESILR